MKWVLSWLAAMPSSFSGFQSLGFGAVLPLLLIWLAPATAPVLGLALVCHVAGVFVERWLFFAEAAKVVSLY